MAHGSPERATYRSKRARCSTNIRAVLHVRGARRQRVLILDYSPHGLQLEHSSGIALDDHVTVELGSGLRIPMRVAWVSGSSVALRFLGQIEPGHTAMHALDEAVRAMRARRRSSAND
jgi:hypothetical protein